MSRNNKSARLHAQAKQMSATRKSGGSGPKQTEPKHGKKNRSKYNRADRRDFKQRGSREPAAEQAQ